MVGISGDCSQGQPGAPISPGGGGGTLQELRCVSWWAAGPAGRLLSRWRMAKPMSWLALLAWRPWGVVRGSPPPQVPAHSKEGAQGHGDHASWWGLWCGWTWVGRAAHPRILVMV